MAMRKVNIEIDELKLEKVKAITGTTTNKAAVDAAFQELIRVDKQRKILSSRGIGAMEGK